MKHVFPSCQYCKTEMQFRAHRYMDVRIVYLSCKNQHCRAESPKVEISRSLPHEEAVEAAIEAATRRTRRISSRFDERARSFRLCNKPIEDITAVELLEYFRTQANISLTEHAGILIVSDEQTEYEREDGWAEKALKTMFSSLPHIKEE